MTNKEIDEEVLNELTNKKTDDQVNEEPANEEATSEEMATNEKIDDENMCEDIENEQRQDFKHSCITKVKKIKRKVRENGRVGECDEGEIRKRKESGGIKIVKKKQRIR